MNTQKCLGLTTKQVNTCDRFERNFITKACQTVSYQLVSYQLVSFVSLHINLKNMSEVFR